MTVSARTASTGTAAAGPTMRYAATHRFAVTPERLWSEIEQFEHFESWWSWLERFSAEPARLRPGTVLTGVVHPPLPYRMGVRIDLCECVRPQRIRAHVRGDLLGTALLELLPIDTGTEARVSWTLEMTQPAMRLAARVARPLLCWGHDRVVDATVNSFRRRLHDQA